MEATSIILTVCIFILIYVVYYYVWASSTMLMKSVTPGTQTTTIDVSKIDTGSNVGSVNFTYSLWFNINDWNYHYGEKKPLFRRLSTAVNEYCPYVYFDTVSDDNYYPDGFVVGYMTAFDSNPDPRYTIAIRVFNYSGTVSSAEIPITSVS